MSKLAFNRKLALLHALLVAGILGGINAYGDTIVQDNVMVTAPVPNVRSLGHLAAGRWTVTVTDLVWPQFLQSLSFAITDFSGVLSSRSESGALIYDVQTPTSLFATVYALPNAGSRVGAYHIDVVYTPAAPPVPLPAAAWLLLSGVCGIAAFRRKHATVTNSVVQ